MTWEERWHPLREEWVVIAAHRQDRPWSGDTLESSATSIAEYVSDCYLCPGNSRISGKTNPKYEQIFVFDNDHPSVALDAPVNLTPVTQPYLSRPATGISRVVCYSPLHNVTLAELGNSEIETLLRDPLADVAATVSGTGQQTRDRTCPYLRKQGRSRRRV